MENMTIDEFINLPSCPNVEERTRLSRSKKLDLHKKYLLFLAGKIQSDIVDGAANSASLYGGFFGKETRRICPYPMAVVRELQKKGFKCDYERNDPERYSNIAHEFTVSLEGDDFDVLEEAIMNENPYYKDDLPHLANEPPPEVVEKEIVNLEEEIDCELFSADQTVDDLKGLSLINSKIKNIDCKKTYIKSISSTKAGATKSWGLIKMCSNAVDDWIDSLFTKNKDD